MESASLIATPSRESWAALVALSDGLDPAQLDALDAALLDWPDALRRAPDAWLRAVLATGRQPALLLARVLRFDETFSTRLDSENVARLARCPDVARVTELRFVSRGLRLKVMRPLAQSRCFPALRVLEMSDTPVLTSATAARVVAGLAGPCLEELVLARCKKLDKTLIPRLLDIGGLSLRRLSVSGRLTAAQLALLLAHPLAEGLTHLDFPADVPLPDADIFSTVLPELRSLSLSVSGEPGEQPLDLLRHVEVLSVRGSGASALLAALGRAGSTALRRVRVLPADLGTLAPLLGSARLPALAHLDLCDAGLSLSSPPPAAGLSSLRAVWMSLGFVPSALSQQALEVALSMLPEGLESLTLCPLGAGLRELRPFAAALAASSHLSGLRHLCCARVVFDFDGIVALLAAEHLRGLRTLDLRWSHGHLKRAGRMGDVKALADPAASSSLQTLLLDCARLTDGGLRVLLREGGLGGLKRLGLQRCSLGSEAGEIIAGAAQLSGLHTLDLSWNSIDDRSVAALAGAPHLASVRRLDLGCNNEITLAGLRAIDSSPHLRGLRSLVVSFPVHEKAAVIALLRGSWLRTIDLSAHAYNTTQGIVIRGTDLR